MIHRLRHSLILLCLALVAALIMPQAALAQTAPPEEFPAVEQNNVELQTGTVTFSKGLVSIGPEDHHGLTLTRHWVDSGWRHREVPTMTGSTSNPIITYMGNTFSFTLNGSVYEPTIENGATLNAARTQLILADGTEVNFSATNGYLYLPAQSDLAFVNSIIFPDGHARIFYYNTGSYTIDLGFSTVTYFYRRISSIINNLGYQIKFAYETDTLNEATATDWQTLVSVSAINNAVEYCSPTASCTLTGDWPTAYVDSTSITDVAAETTDFTFSSGRIATITPPGASSATISYTYTSGKVSSVSNRGGCPPSAPMAQI